MCNVQCDEHHHGPGGGRLVVGEGEEGLGVLRGWACSVQCKVSRLQCAICSEPFAVLSVQCKVCKVQGTVYSVKYRPIGDV